MKEQERSPSLELDLNIVKCEETELREPVIDIPTYDEESNDDNSCNQSENEQTSDNENPPLNKKRKSDGRIKSESSRDEDASDESHQNSNTQPTSQSERDKEAAQIREIFSMKCDICSDFEFETLREVRTHYRTVHNDKEGYLTCCGKKFDRRSRILNHVKYHLNPNALSCDQCGKQYKDGSSLKTHVATHTTPVSIKIPHSYKCDLCAKAYSNSSALAQHKRLQHGMEKDQTFQCDKCNKNYPTKYALASHVRIVHELANAHVCEICAHVCKSKPLYRDHMQKHSGTTQPKAQCNVCGAWLKHEASLRAHLKQHKDDFVNCTICYKKIQKYSLKKHIRMAHQNHPKLRVHQCILCDKAFRFPKFLKEHMAVHTGQDLYKCAYCERMFKSGANMYSHRKKAHFAEWTRDFAKGIAAENTPTSNEASLITTNATNSH